MGPFSYLNCDKVDCSTVKGIRVRHAVARQQRKELLALVYGAFIDISKAIFSISANVETESLINSYMGALESLQSALNGFLLLRYQDNRIACKPERLSEGNPTGEPTRALLSHGNITFHSNQFQDGIPCFASRSACNSHVRALHEYSGSNDPTLTEAATWNDLMEVC